MKFSKERVANLIKILGPKRPTRIIDIGAHPIHEPPYKKLFDMGACEVWGFEPQSAAYEQLIAQKSPLEHYYPYVIGDGQPATLHICKSEGFTSTLPPNQKTLDYLG